MNDTEIFLFTSENCKYCFDLKKKLKEKDITFFEFKIEETPLLWRDIINTTKINATPMVIVIKSSGNFFLIPSIDFQTINELFGKIIEIVKE